MTALVLLCLVACSLPLVHARSNTSRLAGYIITLHDDTDVSSHVREISCGAEILVTHQFEFAGFRAYAARLSTLQVEVLANHSEVAHVEPDHRLAHQDHLPDGPAASENGSAQAYKSQQGAPWGLSYISHSNPTAKGSFNYVYDSSAGAGTYAYVLDTGINIHHGEFEGRASLGYDALRNGRTYDPRGRGTQVAGVIGGKTFGVAKKCFLISVKVIDITTTVSMLLDGYSWAVKDILAKKRQDKAVINCSLLGPRSRAINRAVNEAARRGVTTVVAAGNHAGVARAWSPASAEGAITFSAVDKHFVRPYWANRGPEVALFAPGVDVASVHGLSSGTSIATPFVAGLVLYFKAQH